jgi:hypothetical protein
MSGGIASSKEIKADTLEETRTATDSQGTTAQSGHLGQEVPRELSEP